MKVRVLRAFLVAGERVEPGTVVDLPDALARGMIVIQKAEPEVPIAPPAGPMTTDSAAAVVAGKKRRAGNAT